MKSSISSPCVQARLEKQPKAIHALLRGWFDALNYLKREPNVAAGHMAIRQQTTGEQYLEALKGVHIPSREEKHYV